MSNVSIKLVFIFLLDLLQSIDNLKNRLTACNHNFLFLFRFTDSVAVAAVAWLFGCLVVLKLKRMVLAEEHTVKHAMRRQ